MNGKPIKNILSIISVTTMMFIGLSSVVAAAETVLVSAIPDALIARDPKQHDPSLAVSTDAVLYKIKKYQQLALVDVRRGQDFERLHIPGSINIPLHTVKTKTYLKSLPVVLINEGFPYTELESECRRLVGRSFQVFILDGGLPVWQRKGGRLAGDLLALEDMKTVSPRVFFQEKDYENTLVIDISPARSEASSRLIPYANHIPVLVGSDASAAELSKLIAKNKNMPFQSVVIFNKTGGRYETAQKTLNRMGIESFNLKGGVAAYQKYLEGLLLSWEPRDSRVKTVSMCKSCGEKAGEE